MHVVVGPKTLRCPTNNFWEEKYRNIVIDVDACGWQRSATVEGEFTTYKNGVGFIYRSWLRPIAKVEPYRHWFKTAEEMKLDIEQQRNKGVGMMKELMQDGKAFVKENRQVIFTVVALFLADHFFLNGTLRTRLVALCEKMLGKLESKVDKE